MKISEKPIDIPIDLLDDPYSDANKENFEALTEVEAHHKILVTNVNLKAKSLKRASDSEIITLGANLSNYFKTQVLPHADAEEETIYSKVASIEGIDLEEMIDDHRRLKVTLLDFDAENDRETKINLATQLKDLFYFHVQKENQQLIPKIFNSNILSLSELISDLHHKFQSIITELHIQEVDCVRIDVRDIIPAKRHPAIFGAFEELQIGHRISLINDHDPKPLYYQFESEYPAQFTWDYEQMGPRIWQVSIVKLG
jgi:uncharacterized protein (DUF2249 family)/hemerythrin superfamily protein